MTPDPRDVAASLAADRPAFHRAGSGELVSYAVDAELLRFLAAEVQPGWRTFETGAGASSVVLLAAGARHTSLSPSKEEAERVRATCTSRGIPTGDYEHVVGESQFALPDYGPEPVLDLALVDGDHAFPAPAIDWFHLTRWCREGAIVALDDVQLWQVRVVTQLLDRDAAFDRLQVTPRWAAYRLAAPGAAIAGRWWGTQPSVPVPWPVGRLRRWFDRVRRRLTH